MAQQLNTEQKPSLRQRTFLLLDTGDSQFLSKLIDWFLMSLIAINVFAVIMETVESFQQQFEVWLYWLEIFSVLVFTIEYVLRLWSCVEAKEYRNGRPPALARFKYAFTPMAIIDLLAIAPFYLAFLFNIDLRFLRVLRLLRIFKLTRYSGAMSTMLKVMREELSSFTAAIFIMIVIMIIAASGIYLVEKDHQPEFYGSIPQSMWWSIVTLTTVGYGDVYPITIVGKVFAAIIMVVGVGLVALPTGILASGFSDNLHRSREKMTQELSQALADDYIDETEQQHLEILRQELGLTEEKFDELKQSLIDRKSEIKANSTSHRPCPTCGK